MPDARKVRVEVFLGRPSSDLFTPTLAPSGLVVSVLFHHLAPNHSLVFPL